MSQLEKILNTKRKEIKALIPRIDKLKTVAMMRENYRPLRHYLSKQPNQLQIIAEVKQTSPSNKGSFTANFSPRKQAKIYEQGGANMISVLTDESYFQGSLQHLSLISANAQIPILRKDFIIEKSQIYESVVTGADAILLIIAALEKNQLKQLYQEALTCRLDIIIEVYTEKELDTALELENIKYIAINNRNLHTFEIDLSNTEKLAFKIPSEIFVISASGIKNKQDAQRMLDAGADGILVGETLMRAENPQMVIENYLHLQRTSPSFN